MQKVVQRSNFEKKKSWIFQSKLPSAYGGGSLKLGCGTPFCANKALSLAAKKPSCLRLYFRSPPSGVACTVSSCLIWLQYVKVQMSMRCSSLPGVEDLPAVCLHHGQGVLVQQVYAILHSIKPRQCTSKKNGGKKGKFYVLCTCTYGRTMQIYHSPFHLRPR